MESMELNFRCCKLLFVIIGFFFSTTGICGDESSFTWKSVYYGSIPNKVGIDKIYCQQHEPGIFIGQVKDQLANGALTNHRIKMDHFTFHVQNKNGLYLMDGDVTATGKTAGKFWQDHIHYYVYKLTVDGITQGIWSSEQCKGFYFGKVLKK